MQLGTYESRPLGEVEVEAVLYFIVEADIEHYQVFRRSDGARIGAFRGSPTSMWLLEPEVVELDLLRAIVHAAVVEGVLGDTASD